MPSFLSRLIKVTFFVFLLCVLLVLLLPSLASTSLGSKMIVAWINDTIPGKIELSKLDLNWSKGQTVEGVVLKDSEGQTVLKFDKFFTEASLFQLLSQKARLGLLQLEDLKATVITDNQGQTNLQKALGISVNRPDGESFPPSTIVADHLNASIDLFSRRNVISARIDGTTLQDNLQGQFEVDIFLSGMNELDLEKIKNNAQNYLESKEGKQAKIHVNVANFPVDLIDRLVALKNSSFNGFFRSILGDRINLSVDKVVKGDELSFDFLAQSPLMKGNLSGKIYNEIVSLHEPATLNFTLSPELISLFSHQQINVTQPTQLKVNINDLKFPLNLNHAKLDPCQLGFEMQWMLSETEVMVSSLGSVYLSNFNGNLTSLTCNQNVDLKLKGEASLEKRPFSIEFNTVFAKPTSLKELIDQIKKEFKASIRVMNFPIQSLPSLKNQSWVDEVGKSVNAEITLSPGKKNGWDAKVSLQTSHINLKEAQLHIEDAISLKVPALIDWKIEPLCLQNILSKDNLKFDHACNLQFKINLLQIPFDNFQQVKFQIESMLSPLQFSKLSPYGKVTLKNFHLKIDGLSLNEFDSQLKGELALLTSEDQHSSLLVEPLKITQVSQWKLSPSGKISMPFGQLLVHNSLTNLKAEVSLTPDHLLEIKEPAEICYILTPSTFQELFAVQIKESIKLEKNTLINFSLDPTTIDLNDLDLSAIKLNGIIEIDDLALVNSSHHFPALKDISLPWTIDGKMNTFYAKLEGSVISKLTSSPGQLSANLQLWPSGRDFNIKDSKAEINLNFANIPTSLFSLLMGHDDMSSVMGPLIDLDLKAFFDPLQSTPGYWDLKMDSELFHVDGRFKFDKIATLLDSSKPATIQLTITPNSYQSFKKQFSIQNNLQLSTPFTLSGNITQFKIPLEGISDQSGFNIDINSTTIRWQGSIPPLEIKGKINSQNVLEDIKFSLQANASSPTTLALDGNLSHLFRTNKELNDWKEIGLRANFEGKNLNSSFLKSMWILNEDQAEMLQALFGETFNINAHCQLQDRAGSLQASARGTQADFLLDGLVSNGVLTLKKPLEGSFKMTPLLSQTLLAKKIPILSSATSADNPISVRIDPTSFSCPLIPFQLDRIQIGKGSLDFGKMTFKNEGELHSFLSIIHSISEPFLTIWFTPIYFHMDHGMLSIRRFDMLVANSYQLASWGKMNLNENNADLVIGLSAGALYTAFGIQGLEQNYMLQVPLHYANGTTKIDKKKATARIGALVAQSQVESKVKLLGNILDLALSKDEEVSPSPTTQPFPWSNEWSFSPNQKSSSGSSSMEESQTFQEDKKEKKKRKHKHKDSPQPLENLQDEAVKILDQLFNQ